MHEYIANSYQRFSNKKQRKQSEHSNMITLANGMCKDRFKSTEQILTSSSWIKKKQEKWNKTFKNNNAS